MNRLPDDPDTCVLILIKGAHRFVFVFHDTMEERSEALRTLGRFAVNKDLDFTWYDAAQLSQRIRKGMQPGQSVIDRS